MSLAAVLDKYQWVKGAWVTTSWNPQTLFSDGGSTDYENATGVCAEGAIHMDMGRYQQFSTEAGVEYQYNSEPRYISHLMSGEVRQQIDVLNFRDSLHRVGDYIAVEYLRRWLGFKYNQNLMKHKGRSCPCWRYQDPSRMSNTITEIDGIKYCIDWRLGLDTTYVYGTITSFNDQHGLTEEVIKKFLSDLDKFPQYRAVRQLLRMSPEKFETVQKGFKTAYMVKRSQLPRGAESDNALTYSEILSGVSREEIEVFHEALLETRCI